MIAWGVSLHLPYFCNLTRALRFWASQAQRQPTFICYSLTLERVATVVNFNSRQLLPFYTTL
jgi:hypothetical protein